MIQQSIPASFRAVALDDKFFTCSQFSQVLPAFEISVAVSLGAKRRWLINARGVAAVAACTL
jgi:hypothetical protein